MPKRKYFRYNNNGPYTNKPMVAADLIIELTKRDVHAVAVFLQPRIFIGNHECETTKQRQTAIEIATDPSFLKYALSPEFRASIPLKHYATTWICLTQHTPIVLPLVEQGALPYFFSVLNEPSLDANTVMALRCIFSIITNAKTHSHITPHHIDTLLCIYNRGKDEKQLVCDIIEKLCPSLMVTERLIVSTQQADGPQDLSTLLSKQAITLNLAHFGVIDTLCGLSISQLTPIALEVLLCMAKTKEIHSHWTPRHALLLLHHLLSGGNVATILEELPQELFDHTAFCGELQQLAVSTLTDRHIVEVQLALHCAPINRQLATMGLLETLTSSINSVPSPTLPRLFELLFANEANHAHITMRHIVPLLQYLITTNNLFQLTTIIYKLRNHKEVGNVFSTEGVLHSLVAAATSESATKSKAWELLGMMDRAQVCSVIAKAGVLSTKIPKYLQQSMLAYQVVDVSRDKRAPWYIDTTLARHDGQKKYTLLPGQPHDLELVAKLYQRSPVPGYDVKGVTVTCNADLLRSFIACVISLQHRKGKHAVAPHWKTAYWIPGDEITQRQKVMEQFHSLAHKYTMTPDVSFMLNWNNICRSNLDSVLENGFAHLASVDRFFGKGFYTTPNAEYAHRVYSSGVLLLNWVAVFSPFPVIARDEPELSEKGNFGNYDAHFVPIYSPKHPQTSVYHACEIDQEAQYTELVVFESVQMLARYVVELQPNMPREISLALEEQSKESEAHARKISQFEDQCSLEQTLDYTQQSLSNFKF